MIYIVYFGVFLATLIVTACMVMLYSKGYRIVYEDKHFTIKNIKHSVRYVAEKVKEVSSVVPSVINQNNKATYESLKADFPNFDIEQMKEDIKKYIISYFKGKNDVDIKKTDNYKEDLSDTNSDGLIDEKSLQVLRTIMNRYTKEDGLAKIYFNTTLKYNKEYQNGSIREVEENYITEFVHSIADLNKNKKVKCPKCGNDVNIVGKDIKCSYCNEDLTESIWYLNNIEKI